VVLTGEVGSGKTTLLQTVLRSLSSRTVMAHLVNTILDPKELLEAILIDFGIESTSTSKPAMVRDLARLLVDQRARGNRVLVVIDEAQGLSRAALEELRMLSNLETEKAKLLQIILVGQPDLRQRLASPDLEQLRQRITVRYHLLPLDAHETEQYINHRLRHAALGKPLTFSREVTDAIHVRSRGIPRIINVICDAALLIGYSENRRRIAPSLLEAVFEELESTGLLTRPWGRAPIDLAPYPEVHAAGEPPSPAAPPSHPASPDDTLRTAQARAHDRDPRAG
jgi:type II secretory pathway predicted ATPase ExeA